MSTIYPAGQYDDAFSPKRLGNWEAGAKDICYKSKQFVPGERTEVIVDSRGHLLPWVPRDKSRTWGLLNYYMHNNYRNSFRQSMRMLSSLSTTDKGQEQRGGNLLKRKFKLPRYAPKRAEHEGPQPDLLLEYLQDLRLPIVWIVGPATKHTFQTRKQFSKRLAASLGYSYVNLDEKIVEWKERQMTCTCDCEEHLITHNNNSASLQTVSATSSSACNQNHQKATNSLAQTSIAPSKLPTNVPPLISTKLPSPPPSVRPNSSLSVGDLFSLLESERIAFDTALPMERNKILELYKFAMAEGLPCGGFVMDSVPFDMVEGMQFEKVFYPAALAIYFSEGVPQRKNKKPKDRRVTACSNETSEPMKKIMSPLEYLERSRKEHNVYLRSRNHKRLGNFSPVEGEKICRQYGSKTIRIINAEDVEKDTMDFLNELVRKNLDKYQQEVAEGNAGLEFGGVLGERRSEEEVLSPCRSPPIRPFARSTVDLEDLQGGGDQHAIKPCPVSNKDEREEGDHILAQRGANLPPALITAHESNTSVFTLPNIFTSDRSLSSPSPPTSPNEWKEDDELVFQDGLHVEGIPPPDFGGAGDNENVSEFTKEESKRQRSAHLWERIMRLESKVADLRPVEENSILDKGIITSKHSRESLHLPPPTAYAVDVDTVSNLLKERRDAEEEEQVLTAAIRNAMPAAGFRQEYMSQMPPPPVEFDYGAGGDCGMNMAEILPPIDDFKEEYYPFGKTPSDPKMCPRKRSAGQTQERKKSTEDTPNNYDAFYDT